MISNESYEHLYSVSIEPLYGSIRNILEDNNIEERFHTKKDSITYYRKSMNEIFTKLKNEKNNNPQLFYEKYRTNNMISIAAKIWKEEYKLK